MGKSDFSLTSPRGLGKVEFDFPKHLSFQNPKKDKNSN